MSNEEQAKKAWTFADRLNYLFDNLFSAKGQSYTHEEVQEETGVAASYISKLRNGKATNPGYKIVGALAKFFGVSPNFFYEEDQEKAIAELKEILHLDPIALRASKLSSKSRQAVLDMLTHIATLEDDEDTI